NNRGSAYAFQGDIDRAIADFSEAIRLEPRVAAVHYNRGKLYQLHDAPSPILARRSGSTPSSHPPTTTGRPRTSSRDIATAPSPPLTRRSDSIPRPPTPTATGASCTSCKGITTAPSPTLARRSGSIRSSPPPTTTAAMRTAHGATSAAPS